MLMLQCAKEQVPKNIIDKSTLILIAAKLYWRKKIRSRSSSSILHLHMQITLSEIDFASLSLVKEVLSQTFTM